MSVGDWELHAYTALLAADGSAPFALGYLTSAILSDRHTRDELQAMVAGQDRARRELNDR